ALMVGIMGCEITTVIVLVVPLKVPVETTMSLLLVSLVALPPASTTTPVNLLSPALQSLRTRTVKVPLAAESPGSVVFAAPSTAPVVQVAPTRCLLHFWLFGGRVSR